MTELYLHASRLGHFGRDDTRTTLQHQDMVRKNIRSIVRHGVMRDFDRQAQALVFERPPSRVGFAVVAQLHEPPASVELHVMMVASAWRGRGYGGAMLDEVIMRWRSHSDIYVRCHPVSVGMMRLLETRGFTRVEATVGDDSRFYLLQGFVNSLRARTTGTRPLQQ